jgi:hypothetical protein
MNVIHYIGLDVHKKTISYCIKTADGRIVREAKLPALRYALRSWAEGLREPWCGAMEATLFSAWIYDTLKPYAQRLVMGHPAVRARLILMLAEGLPYRTIQARMTREYGVLRPPAASQVSISPLFHQGGQLF